jgi:hypothetical protein
MSKSGEEQIKSRLSKGWLSFGRCSSFVMVVEMDNGVARSRQAKANQARDKVHARLNLASFPLNSHGPIAIAAI